MANTKEQLKAQADEILKDSGFVDIEQADGNLKRWHSSDFQYFYTPDQFRAKQTYYQWAGQFLHDYEFKDTRQKLIWQLHSEGKSSRAIIKALKSKNITVYRDLVDHTIRDLRKIMLGPWQKKQQLNNP